MSLVWWMSVVVFGFWAVVVTVTESVGNEEQSQQNDIPKFVRPCWKKDPHFEDCVRLAIENLRPFLSDGIESLGIPSLEPLHVPKLTLESRSQSLNFIGNLRNNTIYGVGNFSINRFDVNIDNYTATVHLTLPKLKAKGNYDIDGNVLLIQIRSRGVYRAILSDVKAVAYFQGRETFKNGVKHLRIVDTKLDFDLDKSQFRVKDYLIRGPTLSDAINNFLNKNSPELIAELKPAISSTIVDYVKPLLSKALAAYPLSVWVPDIDTN